MHKLYAIPHSLYAGRARSYLIKAGIPFQELSSGHESFKAEVLPKAGLPTIPILVTPDGEVLRDGAIIIDHLEAQNGSTFQPLGAKQKSLSLLFAAIGAEGLLRPAMHYRWNFPEQREFIHYHFLHSQRETETREEKTQYMMSKMQTVAGMWGVKSDTIPLIETLYLELLQRLNSHFEQVPYLLGWQPSIGDFGMIAPLYAHLGRDPVPANIMMQQAVRVYRWVERMNRPDHDASEYLNPSDGYLANDHVPTTLIEVLKVLAEDFVPESNAQLQTINHWLAEHKPKSGTVADRFLGEVEFSVRGQSLRSVAQPYRFAQLQRVQSHFDGLSEGEQAQVQSLYAQCGVSELIDARLSRTLGWKNNLDVWL